MTSRNDNVGPFGPVKYQGQRVKAPGVEEVFGMAVMAEAEPEEVAGEEARPSALGQYVPPSKETEE